MAVFKECAGRFTSACSIVWSRAWLDEYAASLSKYLQGSDASLLAGFLAISSLLLVQELPSAIMLLLLCVIGILCSNRFKWLRPLVVALLATLVATHSFNQHLGIELPRSHEGRSISVRGQVIDLPGKTSTHTRFLFQVLAINESDEYHAKDLSMLVQQKVQLSCYRCLLDLQPGQVWRFTVRLKNPHGYASWGAFDFEKYLFRSQVVARGYVRNKEAQELLAEPGYSINNYRQDLQRHLQQRMQNTPNALGMIAALMIGDKSLLSQEQREVFKKTGLSHLMAISGLHVGLVFFLVVTLMKYALMPIAKLFYWQPRQNLVLLPGLCAAYAYSALAGFAISTERALLMLTVFVLCRLLSREISLLRVLLLAAFLLLIYDPYSVLDAGFWLSCGAVMIIGVVQHYRGKLSLLQLQPLLWLGMMPLTLLIFVEISLVSPLVNLIAVPIFGFLLIPLVLFSLILLQLGQEALHAMLLGGLAVVFEWLYTFLAEISAWSLSTYVPGRGISTLMEDASAWFYPGLLLILWAFLARWRVRHMIFLAGIAISVLIPWKLEADQDSLQIALLDVGQGLSMVVQVSDYVLVYDTGPAYPSGFNAADAVLIPYLRSRGIQQIDQLIISHADNDHIGGLDRVLATIPVKHVLTSRTDRVARATSCMAGQSWSIESVEFSIISPDEATPQGSNNLSCVLRIEFADQVILITGDIERRVEQHLLSDPDLLKADVMLVPHQGSKTSSTQKFLDAIKPELAIVAAGYRNHYGHPHAEVVERYNNARIHLLSTIDNGSILLNFNKNGYTVTSYRVAEKRFWNRQKMPN
ncbi:MAG: DNA internalization-related competence protein ComEC/Rec2 [Pseudomonadota bacterium]